MGGSYITRPHENVLFRRCRRAWDFAARERRDLELIDAAHIFDFSEAIHDALDAFYYPGMWDWGRAIVRPIARAGFEKSMRRQRDAWPGEPSADQLAHWERHMDLGTALLDRYFDWAAGVDRFTPIQVATLFDVNIPDPADPETGLITPDGRALTFRVRIDLAVIDDHELYWLVEHRFISGTPSAEPEELRLDEQALTRSWAWQQHFLARIEGTIYNEVRLPPDPTPVAEAAVTATPAPAGVITQRNSGAFRRTRLPRSAAEIARRGVEVAQETQDMIDPSLRIYPNPSPAHCPSCAYRPPCLAMNQGADEGPLLAAAYRRRVGGDFEPGRLGSLWGFVPEIHRVREHRAPGAKQ